jgi:hypothetical protein
MDIMTAVEWLFDKMFDSSWNVEHQNLWLNKAKEIEMQQIIMASASAYKDMFGTDGTEYGEKYYNKLTQNDK